MNFLPQIMLSCPWKKREWRLSAKVAQINSSELCTVIHISAFPFLFKSFLNL